jgi:hypothetical protein
LSQKNHQCSTTLYSPAPTTENTPTAIQIKQSYPTSQTISAQHSVPSQGSNEQQYHQGVASILNPQQSQSQIASQQQQFLYQMQQGQSIQQQQLQQMAAQQQKLSTIQFPIQDQQQQQPVVHQEQMQQMQQQNQMQPLQQQIPAQQQYQIQPMHQQYQMQQQFDYSTQMQPQGVQQFMYVNPQMQQVLQATDSQRTSVVNDAISSREQSFGGSMMSLTSIPTVVQQIPPQQAVQPTQMVFQAAPAMPFSLPYYQSGVTLQPIQNMTTQFTQTSTSTSRRESKTSLGNNDEIPTPGEDGEEYFEGRRGWGGGGSSLSLSSACSRISRK